MKEKNWELGRRLICVVSLTVLMIGIFLGSGAAQEGDTGQVEQPDSVTKPMSSNTELSKDEIVYGILSASGAVDSVYVVNHFTAQPGTWITDHGPYTSVSNLTNTEPLAVEDETVAFTSETDSFYYQGNLGAHPLPWTFDIQYSLDDNTMAAKDLPGVSGHLKIEASAKKNPDMNPVFVDNYMLQISVTLDTDLCKNIEADGGTFASAGKDTVIAFTVLPGKEADFSIEADVHDFEMSGISITGMPYSMDIDFPDMDDSLGDLEKLPDAISELNDGVGELESGTINMRTGIQELAQGSKSIKKSLALLSESGNSLKSGSNQIEAALSQISRSLSQSGVDDIDLSSVEALPTSLGELKTALDALGTGLTELKGGFVAAKGALESAISTIPEASVSAESIEGLASRQTTPEDAALIGVLAANYQAAQTVRATYQQISPAFDAVEPAIDQTAGGLSEMSQQLGTSLEGMESQLSQLDRLSALKELTSGLSTLSGNYAEFNDGLHDYVSGISTLSANYKTFDAGIAQLPGGVGELSSGVGQLHEGTQTLRNELADLPTMIQDEIDKMKAEYMPGEFEPVSFTSPDNKDTDFVQFILQCEGIKIPAKEVSEPTPKPQESFWDRLTALF